MYLIDVEQLQFLHYHLRAVLRWVSSRFGMCFVITSLYRMDDNGVHGQLPCRGTDLRCHSETLAEEICNLINAHWTYDPERPGMNVAIAHDTGRGYHLHIQVHPNTLEV
jgi:hypothetical protein